jgi:hypothetical protein
MWHAIAYEWEEKKVQHRRQHQIDLVRSREPSPLQPKPATNQHPPPARTHRDAREAFSDRAPSFRPGSTFAAADRIFFPRSTLSESVIRVLVHQFVLLLFPPDSQKREKKNVSSAHQMCPAASIPSLARKPSTLRPNQRSCVTATCINEELNIHCVSFLA